MLAIIAAVLVVGPQKANYIQAYNPVGPVIVVTMDRGGSFEITTDPATSPKTVSHILGLVRNRFYDRQRIHRVEPWVTQWGAPASRNEPLQVKDKKTGKLVVSDSVGDGGSGKDISVFEAAPNVDYLRGTVGIASNGLQLPGDSQLFVLKKDAMRLYRSYAVVGKVTKGMDVVDKIKFGDRIRSMKVRGERIAKRHRRHR
ncbi:MAG: peptidylprolyl isomerase [Fimbriimonadaceae bacterium]|jgi:cyclophilin family peptidyl-prolyl cis-trans isomerase|nr:peptidylprolyl isomerase [Fimbriimonadaceae bacterium]